MRLLTPLFLSLSLPLVLVTTAFASEGKVTILSPSEGATLDIMSENRVKYSVDPGPAGDHVHFYVNGDEKAVLRQLEGSYLLDTLPEGQQELCIKVVNKAHTPIGIEQCVTVMME